MTSASWHIRQKRLALERVEKAKIKLAKAKFNRWHTIVSWDVPDIKYIRKFQHGTSDMRNPLTETEMNQQLEKINRELRYGKIISTETGINEIQIGDRSVIHQWTVFLIGYRNRPDGK